MAMKPESLVFEKSGESDMSFDSTSFVNSTTEPISEQEIRAYLSRLQIGQKIQPFGCMIAVEERSFRIIAYSKNAAEMLESVPDVEIEGEVRIGGDMRRLFRARGAQRLERAAMMRNVSLANPILVESVSGKPFYAIIHRIDGGIAIDLEPVRTGEETGGIPTRAISRLQGLPGGEIGLLCDVVVEEVRELTGYDRVMVYKFHEDDGHDEIVAESRRSDLEPYLGRHYPAAHICAASRTLFLMNRVRMICDCRATPVGVVEAEDLNRPLCLVRSTLKAHNGLFMASMDSIASLALAIVVNRSGNDGGSGVKLWGLVVCHHTSPRFVPSPVRYACEFLMQVFGLQIDVEMQLAAGQARDLTA